MIFALTPSVHMDQIGLIPNINTGCEMYVSFVFLILFIPNAAVHVPAPYLLQYSWVLFFLILFIL